MVDRHTEAEGTSKDASASESGSNAFYLMKAEPDSRVVKGKDVKFSVDDFETAQTTAWEGVRNYEARNIMQGMKVGDQVLFYHSNTKNLGIAAFAEVSKEAYPDHTAWDESHPYHDPKSDASSPKWYMIDLRFVSRVSHFVSLSLLRHLSTLSEAPEEMPYLSIDNIQAIKNMALLNKGRLSVQRVEKQAWDAVDKIAKEGDGGMVIKGVKKGTGENKAKGRGAAKTRSRKGGVQDTDENNDEGEGEDEEEDTGDAKGKRKGRKRAKKAPEEGSRKSKRVKK